MENDNSTSKALKRIREKSGLSIRSMAEHLNIAPGSYAHYEVRYKKPFLPMELALQIADVVAPLGVDRSEVMALVGVGSGLTGRATDQDRAELDYEQERAPIDMIPVYDIYASAGDGMVVLTEDAAYMMEFPRGYLQYITKGANPDHLSIIGVRGDSMLPTLADDDIVMLDRSKRDLSQDGVFVIRDIGDGLLVKRIGRASKAGHVMLISDNRDLYPLIEKPLADIEVIGKVIWSGGKV
jgi:phage repressor protein C with HTH and peptisase S24 domain